MSQLKYGWISGGKASHKFKMKASQTFNNLSGRFVALDANGYAELALAADTFLIGYVEAGAETTNAVDGVTQMNVIVDPTAIYRIPIQSSDTVLQSEVGKTCDIAIAGGIQYADVDATVTDVLKIVGIPDDTTNEKWVDVMLNPATTIAGGV